MTWDQWIDMAAIGVPFIAALAVAHVVSGREDERQRQSERRAVQRDAKVQLQNSWLEMDEQLTEVLRLIQAHHFYSAESRADFERFTTAVERNENRLDGKSFEEYVKLREDQAKKVNDSADVMTNAVIEIRRFSRRVKLVEMRVTSEPIRNVSRTMRELVETMIVDVGSQGGKRFETIRKTTFANAFDLFIEAGNNVLADEEIDEPTSISRQKLLASAQSTETPRVRRRWNEP